MYYLMLKPLQTLAEVASWPKLVTPEDGRKYVHDRVKENADYIKVSI